MTFAEKLYTNVLGVKSKKEKERERINFIKELLAIYEKRKIKEKDVHDFAKNIASEFFVDEIVGSKNGGELVINSEKRVQPPVKQYKEVFNLIKEKYPELSMMTLKTGETYEVFYLDNKQDTLFNMKTTGDLSSLETKKIIERINTGRDKWQEL